MYRCHHLQRMLALELRHASEGREELLPIDSCAWPSCTGCHHATRFAFFQRKDCASLIRLRTSSLRLYFGLMPLWWTVSTTL